jgi:hypothetical protein
MKKKQKRKGNATGQGGTQNSQQVQDACNKVLKAQNSAEREIALQEYRILREQNQNTGE